MVIGMPTACLNLHGNLQYIPLCIMQYVGGGTLEYIGLIIIVAIAYYLFKARLHRIVTLMVGTLLSGTLYMAWPSPLFGMLTILSFVALFGFIGLELKNATSRE